MTNMKVHHAIITAAISLIATIPQSAAAQRHEIFSEDIKSLQVVCGGKWLSMPVMQLCGSSPDNVMNISFDDLTHTYRRYTYSIEHCEADWTTSDGLFQSNYIDGFANDNTIEDIEESVNTNVLYTHYSLTIPNPKCRPKISGNYRLTVRDDDTGEKVLSACFMVVEPVVSIGMEATTNTDIDTNNSHQQIGMSVKYNNLRVTDPQTQIKTTVLQNRRWDNAKTNVKPQYITTDGLQWTHNRSYIFEAGNEYHKFESLATSHPTMGIDNISWDGENYHAWLMKDDPRPNYLYDEDANGAFYIRNSDNYENDRTSDYLYVHFTLNSPQPAADDVYINGAWTYDSFAPAYRMEYNNEKKRYEANILLKQGYYSYQYITLGPDGTTGIMPTEGSFFQTENKYSALIYFRGQGERTDRLVGYKEIQIK